MQRAATRRPRRATGVVAALVGLAAALALGLGSAPADAATLRKMFWGPVAVDGVSQFPLYRRLGVDVFQTAITWNDAAPRRPRHPRDPRDPAYVWPASVDQAITEARRHGMQVALMLAGAPGWANGGRPPTFGPRRPADYAAFARAAARRYPSVRIWMVWGEPNSKQRFQPLTGQARPTSTRLTTEQSRAPRAYARLLDAAYGTLKAERRRNLVVGGMTFNVGDIRPANWVRAMRLPDGRPPRMDLYGHNPFGMRKPSLGKDPSDYQVVDFSDLPWFSRVVDRALARPRGRRHLRLYLSEYTIPTAADEFGFHVSLDAQARWIPAGFHVARRLGAWGLGWIHLYDGDNAGSGARGGLLFEDGTPKPALEAFRRAN